jgi:hypothetical protein
VLSTIPLWSKHLKEGVPRRLRENNLLLPWMFDVLPTTQTASQSNIFPTQVYNTHRYTTNKKMAFDLDRMTARALATLPVKIEANYRRLA